MAPIADEVRSYKMSTAVFRINLALLQDRTPTSDQVYIKAIAAGLPQPG
jgi:hypothetical protein